MTWSLQEIKLIPAPFQWMTEMKLGNRIQTGIQMSDHGDTEKNAEDYSVFPWHKIKRSMVKLLAPYN